MSVDFTVLIALRRKREHFRYKNFALEPAVIAAAFARMSC